MKMKEGYVMKYKLISLLATTCIMETAQIMFQTPWTLIEFISAGSIICLLIYYFIQELEHLERRKQDDLSVQEPETQSNPFKNGILWTI